MKRKRRVILGLLTVVLAGALLLSGCVGFRSEVTVNPDLSGTRTVMMAVDQLVLDMMNEETGEEIRAEDVLASWKEEFEDFPGAVVEPYTDPATGNQGAKASIPFTDLDDLANQPWNDDEDDMYMVTWSQEGNVYTLNFAANSELVAIARGEEMEDMSPEEQEMVARMIAGRGLKMSFSIALPGAILEYAPREGATYDEANNTIVWELDLSDPGTAGDVMVRWDNSAASAPVAAPVTEPPAGGVGVAASRTMAAEVQAYADAITNRDRDAYVALMTGGEMIPHPLMSDFPDLFQATDYKIVYNTVFASETRAAAEWTGTWTVDGNTYTLAGVDVLTFDIDGKVTTIKAFVLPSEFVALQEAVK